MIDSVLIGWLIDWLHCNIAAESEYILIDKRIEVRKTDTNVSSQECCVFIICQMYYIVSSLKNLERLEI